MKQGLLTWNPSLHFLSLPTPLSPPTMRFTSVSATAESSVNEQSLLTARERRQLRNEKRESKTGHNWKEEVEEMLRKKPKVKKIPWKEEFNLDRLGQLGPQWWVLRVPRSSAQYTSERLARSLERKFPHMDIKVYYPVVNVTRKLKNGSYSVKPKALFPSNVFLRCIMNKDIHDFVRESAGIGGFVTTKVGNTKKQMNRPKPLPTDDMEEIFRQAKEEQEKADEAFKEEQQREETINPEKINLVFTDSQLTPGEFTESTIDPKPKRRSRKTSRLPTHDQLIREQDKLLRPGSTVRVVSGSFAEFTGVLEKLDRKTERATVGLALFGKQTLVDLDVNEIVLETK